MKKRQIFNLAFIPLLVYSTSSCHKSVTGDEFEGVVLEERSMVKDTSMDSLLIASLPGINCLASKIIGKTLVLSGSFSLQDTSMILITPYLTFSKMYKSAAYTDLENRHILIQPNQIYSFARENSLRPESSFQSILLLVLLHEIGHFKLNKLGAFDEPIDAESGLGEVQQDTEPEYLTSIKRIELAADSVAVVACKEFMTSREVECSSVAFAVLLQIPGMAFNLFGKRSVEDFGRGGLKLDGTYQPYVRTLRDSSASHPNLELRLAFMSYFINPTPESRRIVDELLYNREVTPIIRQELAPYIFQGREKVLSQ